MYGLSSVFFSATAFISFICVSGKFALGILYFLVFKLTRALKLEVERLRSLQVCCSPRNLTADFERDAEEETDSHEIPSSELHTEEQRSKEKDIILLKEAEIKLLKEKLRSTQEQFSEKAK